MYETTVFQMTDALDINVVIRYGIVLKVDVIECGEGLGRYTRNKVCNWTKYKNLLFYRLVYIYTRRYTHVFCVL